MADYTKMKNTELEALLKERNLPHHGRKADMIARLQEADQADPSSAPKSEPAKPAPKPTAKPVESTAKPTAPAPSATTNNAQSEPNPGVEKTTNASKTEQAEPDEATNEQSRDGEEAKPATSFSANLAETSLEEEIARRKKRAAKFGMSEQESDAIKNLERQKRFGTGPKDTAEGVSKLDEALSEKGRRGAKRGRDDSAADSYDDPGLKRRRGAFRGRDRGRGRGRGRRGPPRGDNSESRGGGGGGGASWMSEADRAAAEKRKAKFAS